MKILFTTSEAAPFIKAGGLGDVAGSLPKALIREGIDIRVVLPFYAQIPKVFREKAEFIINFNFKLGWRNCYCGIFKLIHEGVTFYFVDNERYFKRGGYSAYGENDDVERFIYFSKAVLEMLPFIDFYPDIIHTNDWHTATIPVFLDTMFRDKEHYKQMKTIFSIHNIEFQGKLDSNLSGDLLGLDEKYKSLLINDGCLNLMKGAIECTNMVTTVSKTYANEILNPYFSHGLDSILKIRAFKIRGILNGLDYDLFNPETDPCIYTNYNIKTRQLKNHNKRGLLKELGLVQDSKPLIGMVTRLTPQKGIELFAPVMDQIMSLDLSFVILGTGYPQYESFLQQCEEKYKNNFKAILSFSPEIAQKIYASCDLFLMPSKSEPCGLAQLIALRYGTIPIVHEVGGLKDTVHPFDPSSGIGNGITFQSYNEYDMLDAIKRALELYNDKKSWSQMKKNGMIEDNSWSLSAKEYIAVYNEVLA